MDVEASAAKEAHASASIHSSGVASQKKSPHPCATEIRFPDRLNASALIPIFLSAKQVYPYLRQLPVRKRSSKHA